MASDAISSPKLTGTPVTPPPSKRPTRTLDQLEKRPANRHFVEHKYHDHYNDPIADPSMMDHYDSDHSRSVCSTQRGTTPTAFPERLFSILVASERDGFEDVIAWKPHGRCFIIRKKDAFVTEIMPRFFHQTKLTSFQRQLNLYGFIRLTAGRDRGGYYHECFIRGRPDLCRFMVRTRVKGNGLKAASSPETEPDFYAMEPCLSRHHLPLRVDITGVDDGTAKVVETREELKEENNYKASSAQHKNLVSVRKVSLVEVDCESSQAGGCMTKPDHNPGSLRAFERPSLCPRDPIDAMPRVISPTPFAQPPLDDKHETVSLDPLPEAIQLTSQQRTASAPTSGDVVYFEGLQFHYLDHMELAEVEEIRAEPG